MPREESASAATCWASAAFSIWTRASTALVEFWASRKNVLAIRSAAPLSGLGGFSARYAAQASAAALYESAASLVTIVWPVASSASSWLSPCWM